MPTSFAIPERSGSVGSVSPAKEPPVDGTLEIKGPYGKSVVLLELSEGMNSAHIETKIGQRRYTIDIRPSRGLVGSNRAGSGLTMDQMAELADGGITAGPED